MKTRPATLATAFYWISHLLFLTLLPVFNDEAIYLDWGWREIHSPQLLYLSLFDGKQPFLMWLFGIAQILIPSPLLAGRLVSVFAGFLTLLGLLKLTERYFPELRSWQVMLLYSVLPLFVFFDRQALMESAVAAVGVWVCYLLMRFLEKPGMKTASFLGVVFGIGLLIKSTPVIFCLEAFLILLSSFWHKSFDHIQKMFVCFCISLSICFLMLLPLITQPSFMNILSMNSRFSLSLQEMLSLPVSIWFGNIVVTSELLLVYSTPIVLFFALVSSYRILKANNLNQKRILSYFLMGLLLFILTVKNPSPRYIVAFLPLIALFSVDGLSKFTPIARINLKIRFGSMAILPMIISIILISQPIKYFPLMSHITRYSQQVEYVSEWTSGYGVQEACDYLTSISRKENIIVFIRLDSGNPENSMMSCFQRSTTASVRYLPQQITPTQIKQALCENPGLKPYFVSRDLQLSGLESVLTEQQKYMKPAGEKYVGVYQFHTDCSVGKLSN